MKPIRVLVTDDSAFMRKVISDTLNEDIRLTVVGTARNGEEAIKKVKHLRPDVVTLDIEMPVMDGLTALRQLMKEYPLPVVMFSSLTQEDAEKTITAIELGAVDFMTKLSGSTLHEWKAKASGSNLHKWKANKEKISSSVYTAATTNIRKMTSTDYAKKPLHTPPSMNNSKMKAIVAIGTSTGGPKSLRQVLSHLPEHFPAPILIVQHMPPGFTKSLAKRLDAASHIYIKEAENGEALKNSVAYLAPGGYHMQIQKTGNGHTITLTQEGTVNGHRPSVDVLFESLAAPLNLPLYAVIMTGMGADGAEGIKRIKQVHPASVVMAESEETAIVYGMPKAAVSTKKVDEVVNLERIAPRLVECITKD